VGAPPLLPLGHRAKSHIAAALALHKLGRLTDARAQYAAASELQPRCLASLIGVGELHFDVGEVTQARRAFARAAMLCPTAAAPRVSLARLLHHTGDHDGASAAVSQALALAPSDAHALEARAVHRDRG
jgi:Flp pilus assembly protein TadD